MSKIGKSYSAGGDSVKFHIVKYLKMYYDSDDMLVDDNNNIIKNM